MQRADCRDCLVGGTSHPLSPCQACGACCATYRVEFHRGELETEEGTVPHALAEPRTSTTVCMKGTDRQPPRCIALQGVIGTSVTCIIYSSRPGPCREFAPLAAVWRGDEACDEARRRHGLPPLQPGGAPLFC
jgi:hypothetical protein